MQPGVVIRDRADRLDAGASSVAPAGCGQNRTYEWPISIPPPLPEGEVTKQGRKGQRGHQFQSSL